MRITFTSKLLFFLIHIVFTCNESEAENRITVVITIKERAFSKELKVREISINPDSDTQKLPILLNSGKESAPITWPVSKCQWIEQLAPGGTLITIKHGGNCVEVHKEKDCLGDFLTIKPGVPANNNLLRWDLNNKRRWIVKPESLAPCRDKCENNFTELSEPVGGIQVSFYSETDFNGIEENLSVKGCKVIPQTLKNRVASLKSNETFCIELYKTNTCTGSSVLIPKFTPDQLTKDLGEWNFSNKTAAVSPCGFNCPNYTLTYANESLDQPQSDPLLKTNSSMHRGVNGLNLSFSPTLFNISAERHRRNRIVVTLYANRNFQGRSTLISFEDCHNVGAEWEKPGDIKSIRTNGNCIDIFENDTNGCDWVGGGYRRLNDSNGVSNIIDLGWTGGIKFISPCPGAVVTITTTTAQVSSTEVVTVTEVTESKSTTDQHTQLPQITNVDSNDTSISQTVIIVISALVGSTILLLVGLTIAILYFRSKQRKVLTRIEYKEFKNGISKGDNESDAEEMEEALLQPYDNKYEIQNARIKINAKKILGRGSFGIAFRGTLLNHECVDEVAIKTAGECSTPTNVRMLLSEIKIMIHVGSHSNVVSIIGACTAGAYTGKVFLIVELCQNGSLETYLRTKLNNCMNDFGTENATGETSILPTDLMEQLIKWSFHIASGMEHIASKKITHADLATRNVLLTTELVAKITDFGLSRHIHEYKNYVKLDKNDPLPWCWMAIESLKFLNFSTKSDIWAYGVTLWEIFTLGTHPYPGMSWTPDFLLKLEEGMRLHKPPHANLTIFETMKECWHSNPAERPCFTQLKNFFKELLYKNDSSIYANMDPISSDVDIVTENSLEQEL